MSPLFRSQEGARLASSARSCAMTLDGVVRRAGPGQASSHEESRPGPSLIAAEGRRSPSRPAHRSHRSAAAGCGGPATPDYGPGIGRTRHAGSAGWQGGRPRWRRRSERHSRRPRPARPSSIPSWAYQNGSGQPRRASKTSRRIATAPSQTDIAGLLRPGSPTRTRGVHRRGGGRPSGSTTRGWIRPRSGLAAKRVAIRCKTSDVGRQRVVIEEEEQLTLHQWHPGVAPSRDPQVLGQGQRPHAVG